MSLDSTKLLSQGGSVVRANGCTFRVYLEQKEDGEWIMENGSAKRIHTRIAMLADNHFIEASMLYIIEYLAHTHMFI